MPLARPPGGRVPGRYRRRAGAAPADPRAARARRVATVVLDTPPRSETAALEAARAADLVIVPCRPQIARCSPSRAIPRRGRARRGPARGQRADQARRAIQGLGLRVCPHTLGHRTAWGDASASV